MEPRALIGARGFFVPSATPLWHADTTTISCARHASVGVPSSFQVLCIELSLETRSNPIGMLRPPKFRAGAVVMPREAGYLAPHIPYGRGRHAPRSGVLRPKL